MIGLYKKGEALRNGQKPIVLWVPGGMPTMLELEGAIGAALKLRGSKVHAVICDGVFSACVKREISQEIPIAEWRQSCKACKRGCASVLKTMGISFSYIGDYVTTQELNDLNNIAQNTSWENVAELKYKNIGIGKNVQSAVQRYLKGNDLPDERSLVREYAFSGLVCAAAAEQVIRQTKPSKIFMSHGTYVDWGPALHTALALNVPVLAWMASYLPARFYFRHVENGSHLDFHNMSTQAWKETEASNFDDLRSESLDAYLQARYRKDTSFDMKYFMQYTGAGKELSIKYGLDPSKPIWGVMAHINWDAVSDYSPMVYESFNDWMNDTIRTIIDIDTVQWLIKVHPAEAWDNPESGVEYLIKKHFPDLPKHIQVLSAEEQISPLDFFNMLDGGVTVYGTAGLELALHGRPIILAGEAHYGNKGFTYDSVSQEHYRALLKQAHDLPRLDVRQQELVRKYAYCYFIQRQIPISVVKDPKSKWWSFQFDKKDLLLEGRDPVIDFVCEKILDGTDFIMDEQLLRLADENMNGQARC
ncbi:Capsule polysaccharide biosynthesis protein [compost metagenome]